MIALQGTQFKGKLRNNFFENKIEKNIYIKCHYLIIIFIYHHVIIIIYSLSCLLKKCQNSTEKKNKIIDSFLTGVKYYRYNVSCQRADSIFHSSLS